MIIKLNRVFSTLSAVISSQNKSAVTNLLKTMSTSTQLYTLKDAESDICWMDLEMTGLDINKDEILEVSCLITDKNLNIKSEGPSFAVNHPQHVYDNMNEWCIKHHNESGLIDKCKNSKVTPDMAKNLLLAYLKKNLPQRMCPLAGNSVYMDRLFLRKYYPAVDEYLHYRIIDVSTIKELGRRWYPEAIKNAPEKLLAHRSLDDIKDSIAELKYYKEHLFK